MRGIAFAAILLIATSASAQTRCGEVRSFHPLSSGSFSVSIATLRDPPASVFVLLPGGSGLIDLDAQGCPRALRGNSLIRAIPDGIILTSPVSQDARGSLPFVSQDLFQLPLARISVPLFVLGHAIDACVRSPRGFEGQEAEMAALLLGFARGR